MSQKTIQTTSPSRAHALDDFLPERAFNLGGDGERAISIMELLSPNDVRLDPIEQVHHPASATAPVGASVGTSVGTSAVQVWPMLAAGFVALGVTLLVLTMFAKYLDRVV
jgi:hypothetical protein